MLIQKAFAYSLSISLFLSGCVTTSPPGSTFGVGPQLSSMLGSEPEVRINPDLPKLDVIVPVFDPGLVDDTALNTDDTDSDEGVWPELRRAEANRFAYKLKQALEESGAFGAIRVTPDKTATGDIYVLGRIVQSTGEEVEIDIDVFDISGAKWMEGSFDHEVDEDFYLAYRNKQKDPYDPVFKEAADYIASLLNNAKAEDMARIKDLTKLRFAANFSEEAFGEHFKQDGGRLLLASMPSADDAMLRRTEAIRVRDQLFVDGLQENYETFSNEMETSYRIWQEQSFLELEAKSDAQKKAVGEAVAGVALIGLAVLAVIAGARSNAPSGAILGATGGAVAGTVGAGLITDSFQTSEEAKVHREALRELGQSIDLDLAPRVVAFEKETVKLTGDAHEQFAQWRAFLKKVYLTEMTPERQL